MAGTTGIQAPREDGSNAVTILRQLKESIEVGQRRRGDPGQSFVTLQELIDAGIVRYAANTVQAPGLYVVFEPTSLSAVGIGTGIEFTFGAPSNVVAGVQYELLEAATSGGLSSASVVWTGVAQKFHITKTDTTTRYYWIRTVLPTGQRSFAYPASSANPSAAGIAGSSGTLGNVLDGGGYKKINATNMSGNNLDLSSSSIANKSNWLNTASWASGSTGSQGWYSDVVQTGGTSAHIDLAGLTGVGGLLGPYGDTCPLWIAYPYATSGADGGWENSSDLNNVDCTKGLMMSVWINNAQGLTTGNFYLGCSTTNTNNLDGTQNTNPYFNEEATSLFASGKWYLWVGIIHGHGYNGSSSGLSGIYDPKTGKQVYAGTDFVMRGTTGGQTHRAYLYYSTDSSGWMCFAHPRADVMDGSQPTIQQLLASSTDGLIDGSTYIRMPAPPAVSAQATTLLSQSGTTTTINVAAGSFYVGALTVNANSGSVNPGAYGKYFVYFDDPGYGGGAVTYQATTDARVVSQNPFRFYVGTITTVSGGGGGGGGGGSGGTPCCLHESQEIELADGRVIPARELTTEMTLISHEGPTPVVQLRFLPHREWYRVHLNNGVSLFVAGDHRFIDLDGNQLRSWDLKPKQEVRTRDGYAFVLGVEVLWDDAIKVAIEVGEPHTYYVRGVLSHNKLMC